MTNDALHSEAAARNAALTPLREEHRSLARVIEALESVTAQIVDGGVEPDFALLAAMLYYVDVVPERLHHPKEDRYLFAALRLRTTEANAALDRLERDHQRSPQLVSELERALVRWQGGASDGADAFVLALTRFCEFSWNHMRAEETVILPLAEQHLTDEDWLAMAAAFGANTDPLFGAHRRAEFDRLYHRIANLAPRKLKLGLLRPAHPPAAD
jgi:hemerythrin-like domain-containing protein